MGGPPDPPTGDNPLRLMSGSCFQMVHFCCFSADPARRGAHCRGCEEPSPGIERSVAASAPGTAVLGTPTALPTAPRLPLRTPRPEGPRPRRFHHQRRGGPCVRDRVLHPHRAGRPGPWARLLRGPRAPSPQTGLLWRSGAVAGSLSAGGCSVSLVL